MLSEIQVDVLAEFSGALEASGRDAYGEETDLIVYLATRCRQLAAEIRDGVPFPAANGELMEAARVARASEVWDEDSGVVGGSLALTLTRALGTLAGEALRRRVNATASAS